MKISKTQKTEQKILQYIKQNKRRPVNTATDIKPLFKKDAPVTFAVWNLRRRGEIVKVAPGTHRLA